MALYREGLCPLCGRPLEVCTSEEGTPGAPEFVVQQSTCRASREIAETKRSLTDEGKKPLRNAEARLFGTTIRKR